mgnify:CR=1 FL=1
MKTRLGVSFEIDFAHTLRGHPKCGKPHGHTSRIIVEVQGDVKGGRRGIARSAIQQRRAGFRGAQCGRLAAIQSTITAEIGVRCNA